MQTPPGYTEIGHGGDGQDIGNVNYMWYFYDGDLLAKPETPDEPTHMDAFPQLFNMDEKLYKGRYDSSRNVITLIKPRGVGEFRAIPYF